MTHGTINRQAPTVLALCVLCLLVGSCLPGSVGKTSGDPTVDSAYALIERGFMNTYDVPLMWVLRNRGVRHVLDDAGVLRPDP